ncbi:MAG: tetratricopeptide repeat protein [Isosphaeraceae bacterium]
MLFRFSPRGSWRRLPSVLRIALAVALIYPTVVLVPAWFVVWMPPTAQLHATVASLRAARGVYLGVLLALPAATILLAAAVIVGRRRRPRPRWPARGLSVCVALFLALIAAEAVATARLARMRIPFPWLSTSFPDSPGESTVDIVVLGASSACGVPYQDWLSIDRIVAWKLEEAIPGKRFPVNNLASPGLKLDQVHMLLATLKRRPDLVILYAGHNEFQMRYSWGHGALHYTDEIPPATARASLADAIVARSSVYGLIDTTIDRFLQATPPGHDVKRKLVDVPVYTPAEYAERLRDFRIRLEAITDYCERVGATVVLVIPPGNEADFEPNRSFLPADTPRSQRAEFARAFEAARAREAGDRNAAIAAYRRLLDQQPGFAETHYRLARLLEAAGQPREASEHYVAARDHDGLPMRCPSEFQDVYRELAARHPKAILIDGPAVLRDVSLRGVVGDTFFTDGFHPSLIGYTELARAVLEGLRGRGAIGWSRDAPPTRLTPAECATHFAMDADRWRQVCDYAAWFYGHTAYVRFDPSQRLAKAERFAEARRRIAAGTDPEAVGIPGVGTRIDAP